MGFRYESLYEYANHPDFIYYIFCQLLLCNEEIVLVTHNQIDRVKWIEFDMERHGSSINASDKGRIIAVDPNLPRFLCQNCRQSLCIVGVDSHAGKFLASGFNFMIPAFQFQFPFLFYMPLLLKLIVVEIVVDKRDLWGKCYFSYL